MTELNFQQKLDVVRSTEDFDALDYALKDIISDESFDWHAQASELSQVLRLQINGLLYETRNDGSCDFASPLWIKDKTVVDDGMHHPVNPIKNLAYYKRWHRLAAAIEYRGLKGFKKLALPCWMGVVVLVMSAIILALLVPVATWIESSVWLVCFGAGFTWMLFTWLIRDYKQKMRIKCWFNGVGDTLVDQHDAIDSEPIAHSGERHSMHKKKRS